MDSQPLATYCPQCLDRETPGSKCQCGLWWHPQRSEHRHYAVRLTWQEADRRRHAKSRRLTFETLENNPSKPSEPAKKFSKRQAQRHFTNRFKARKAKIASQTDRPGEPR